MQGSVATCILCIHVGPVEEKMLQMLDQAIPTNLEKRTVEIILMVVYSDTENINSCHNIVKDTNLTVIELNGKEKRMVGKISQMFEFFSN